MAGECRIQRLRAAQRQDAALYPAPCRPVVQLPGPVRQRAKNADVLLRQEQQTLRIKRKPEVENRYREQLRSLGFKIATRQSKALPESAGELFELVNDSAWLNFTLNQLQSLSDQGWELQIDEDFGFDLTPVEDWYATVDEAPGATGSTLELGIIVNGQHLSLLPILLNLMRSHSDLLNREKLARRKDDELIW